MSDAALRGRKCPDCGSGNLVAHHCRGEARCKGAPTPHYHVLCQNAACRSWYVTYEGTQHDKAKPRKPRKPRS